MKTDNSIINYGSDVMIENYKKIKQEEAKNAAIVQYREEINKIASLTDIDLTAEQQELTLKERINDIEVALCELVDTILGKE